MDGIHDLGGVQGFADVPHRVDSDPYKPVFHASWEHLAYSLAFLGADALAAFSIDELRHAIERMEPRHYLRSAYYDRILIGTTSLLVEKGVVTREELEELAGGAFPLARPPGPGRDTPASVTFEVGDTVRVKHEFVPGHIRVPAYVRGKTGTVLHRTSEQWPFPDSIGHGMPARKQPTYHVKFERRNLWGETAEPGSVVVDLFEGYLEKV